MVPRKKLELKVVWITKTPQKKGVCLWQIYMMEVLLKVIELVELFDRLSVRLVVASSRATNVQEKKEILSQQTRLTKGDLTQHNTTQDNGTQHNFCYLICYLVEVWSSWTKNSTEKNRPNSAAHVLELKVKAFSFNHNVNYVAAYFQSVNDTLEACA